MTSALLAGRLAVSILYASKSRRIVGQSMRCKGGCYSTSDDLFSSFIAEILLQWGFQHVYLCFKSCQIYLQPSSYFRNLHKYFYEQQS